MSNPVLEAFLGPKASGVKQVLNPEQRRSPTREEKLSALKVTVKKVRACVRGEDAMVLLVSLARFRTRALTFTC